MAGGSGDEVPPLTVGNFVDFLGEEHVMAAWVLHCECLKNVTHKDGLVSEVMSCYGPLVQNAALAKPKVQGRGYPHTFPLDLRSQHMAPQHAQSLIQLPGSVLPLVEFFRCLFDLTQQRQALGEGTSSPTQQVKLNPKHCRAVVSGAPQVPYNALGAASLGLLMSVTGTIVRLGSPAIVCKAMPFKCTTCGVSITLPVDGILEYPTRCEAGKCKGYQFTPMTEDAICVETQILKLQESAQSVDAEASNRSNKMVEVELTESLMDSCVAGDVVTVCGILSTRRSAQKMGAGSHQLCSIKGLSIESATVAPTSLSVHSSLDESADAGRFYEMVQNPRWFSHLVSALAPTIFGHDLVKTALVLALLGGTDRPNMRGAVHTVLMGDPGLGKSQLLRAACNASPRGVFVCANTSSSCGLTVTLARDPSSGETTFEAGAVVHGDGGVTCIDEIDKGAPREHEALLEVMEQQTVSIAKAGMVFSMPIKTTILAAGNPKAGRFNPKDSIMDNVGLNSALLSRFDFVILLKDTPKNEEGVTSHVLDMHVAGSGGLESHQRGTTLDAATLSKFIAVAKKVCHPVLSTEAALLLQETYVQQRTQMRDQGPGDLPVTPRQLQAMVRITEARARAELKTVATKEHARFAVDLLQQIKDVFQQEIAPFAGIRQLAGNKKKDQKGEILDRCQMLLNSNGKATLSHDDIIDICCDVGVKNPEGTVKGLHDAGHLLAAPGGAYKLRR